jgi:hypothetical protein
MLHYLRLGLCYSVIRRGSFHAARVMKRWTIYGLLKVPSLEFVYVGKTSIPLDAHYQGHKKSAVIGQHHYKGVDEAFQTSQVVIIGLDTVQDGQDSDDVEASWYEKLEELGHPLANKHPFKAWPNFWAIRESKLQANKQRKSCSAKF